MDPTRGHCPLRAGRPQSCVFASWSWSWSLSPLHLLLLAALVQQLLAVASTQRVSLPEVPPSDDFSGSSLGQTLRRLACSRRSSKCTGFSLSPPWNFSEYRWISLREQDCIAIVAEFHQAFGRDDPALKRLHNFITPHIVEAVRDCAGGVVTALAYGITDISENLGDYAAASALRLARFLRRSLLECGRTGWEPHVAHAAAGGFTHPSDIPCTRELWGPLHPSDQGTRFAPNFATLSALFGDAPLTCPEGAPRLAVEDVGLAKSFVRCSSGLRFSETWFHRRVLHSDCATSTKHFRSKASLANRANPSIGDDSDEDGSGLDLFFVPLYSVCNHIKAQGWTGLQDHGYLFPFVRPYFELAEVHRELLAGIKATRGRLSDVVLFFPEEKWPVFGMGTAQPEDRPRLLVVEARPVHCVHYDYVGFREDPDAETSRLSRRCFHCFDCFRPDLDVVVPSFVDYFSRSLLRENNMPYDSRYWLLTWFGNGGPGSFDGAYEEVVNWRFKLETLMTLNNVAIGGSHESYEWLLGESRYCLVPKGMGYWTHRLFEALLAGCIPVILSDYVVLPFQGILGIDWRQFSVKWPEDKIGPELYRWLVHVDLTRGPALKAAVDRVACWFDYHEDPEKPGCSAVHATLVALGKQQPSAARAQRDRAKAWQPLEPFWHAPGFRLTPAEEQFDLWLQENAARKNRSVVSTEAINAERKIASSVFGGTLV